MIINDSERLSFKLMSASDVQALWQIDQDPAVMKFLSDGIPTSMDKIKTIFIPRMEKYRNSEKGWGIWQVSDKRSNQYLGWVLIRPMGFFSETPDLSNLELGWRFFQHAWGKGYATEAAISIKNAIVANANRLNSEVMHVSALAVVDNLASIAVMKRMGMQFVKAYLHKDPIGNFDAVHYQMTVKN